MTASNDLALVTGAGGFVGLHLVRSLVKDGQKVRALIRKTEDSKRFTEMDVSLIEFTVGDLRSATDAEAAVVGVNSIYHLAAATVGGIHDQLEGSYVGTKHLLQAAAKQSAITRMVYTSTVSVLAQTQYPATGRIEEDFALEENGVRRGAYAYSKLKCEKLIDQLRDGLGFSIVTLRPGLIWGAGKDQLAMDTSISLGGRVKIVLGSGRKQQPLIHVLSVVEALRKAMSAENPPEQPMTLVDTGNPTQKEYVRLMNQYTGTRYMPLFISAVLLRPLAWLGDKILTRVLGMNPFIQYKFRSKESRALYVTELAQAHLGWTGEPGFEERLKADQNT